MLSLPHLVLTQVRSDTQSEALFAQQHIAAVSRVHGNDGVVLRELADPAILRIHIALAVHTAHPVVRVAQYIQNSLAHSGHDVHVQHNVDRIGDLDTDLGEGRTNGTHGIGNDIHGSALVSTGSDVIEHFISLRGLHPMVGGAGVLFFSGADQSSVLHTGHVVLCGSVQIAVGQQLLVELDHLAGFHSLRLQGVDLFLRTVDPNDLRGLGQFHFFVQPRKQGLVGSQSCFHNSILL